MTLALALSATGCAYGSTQQVLRAQVAAELNCPTVSVRSRPMYQPGYAEGQYEASGCEVQRVYECPVDAGLVEYGDEVCTLIADPTAPAKEAEPAADPMTEDMGAGSDMGDDASSDMGTGDMGSDMDDTGDTGGTDDTSTDEPEPEAKSKSKFKASGKFKVGD